MKDTVPPMVSISTPASGATVSGVVAVTGSASDNTSLGKVQILVDSSTVGAAQGTTSWSLSLDTSGLADGTHVITAKATDRAGNSAVASHSVTVENAKSPEPTPTPTTSPSPSPSPSPTESSVPLPGLEGVFDSTIANLSVAGSLILVGTGALPEHNGVTAVLYESMFAGQLWARFITESTGAYTDVRLPVSSLAGLGNAAYALSDDGLWLMSGGGPVSMTRFALSGSPLPTSASLVSTQSFGNTDSRTGSILTLADGAVVAEWHQGNGVQGNTVAIHRPGGAWQATTLQFMPTSGGTTTLAQHPADGSVWLFASADAFSSIGAARLVPGTSGLSTSWTNPYFIDSRYGEFDADPERPDVAAVADPATGTIALAYESALRTRLSDTVTGSKPAIARIPTSGTPSFIRLPVYVERISSLGLAARGGQLWLAYHPVDLGSLTFDTLQWSSFAAGQWTTAATRKLYRANEPILSAPGYPLIATRFSDGLIHLERA